ncbi:MAG: hypothetical protein GY906_11525 [bacterium]|nr:hypothetical protein [bacterium]
MKRRPGTRTVDRNEPAMPEVVVLAPRCGTCRKWDTEHRTPPLGECERGFRDAQGSDYPLFTMAEDNPGCEFWEQREE